MSDIERLREELAALEHLQWEEWASTLILKENLSKERTDRWAQYLVPYDELTDEVKGHDRVWADRVLDIVRPVISALEEEVKRLQCCGNCGHYERLPMTINYRCNEDDKEPKRGHSMTPWSDCYFTPSRPPRGGKDERA